MNAVAPLFEVTWEKLPNDFVLDDEPVDNIAQPALAAVFVGDLRTRRRRFRPAEFRLSAGTVAGGAGADAGGTDAGAGTGLK